MYWHWRAKKTSVTIRRLYRNKKKIKFSRTRYRALGPELIPVYSQHCQGESRHLAVKFLQLMW